MKIINILKALVISAVSLLGLSACDSDIDKVYVLPGDDIEISGGSDDIVLTMENTSSLVLTVFWSGDGQLALSAPELQGPINTAAEAIEFGKDENFTSPYTINVEAGVRHRQFLGDELNSILGLMGYAPEVNSPLYIRISYRLGANIAPTYSNTLKVNVQTYRIHLDKGRVLDSSKGDTGHFLYSPSENGVYEGFLGVGAWYNWWLLEANNLCWGNLGEDGKSFYASSASDSWNFWYPGEGGCYFTTVNTVEGWWSALCVKSLDVAGDLQGSMTYNQATNQWILPINQASAGTVNITISGQATLYNKETTADGPGIDQLVAFGGSQEALIFGRDGSTITVTVPAGETSLILDLTDYTALSITCGTPDEGDKVSKYLYFSGLVNWDGFDDYISLYDEATLSYGGAHWIDSEWGYRVYTSKDWSSAYKATEESIPTQGTLVFADSDGNIPAPEKGLYVLDFNMKGLTYYVTKVEAVTFTGLNDDWSEHDMTQSDDNPEVFTGEFVKEKETPWGVKVLINHDWGMFFGGGSGELILGHSDAVGGFDGDNDLTVGQTYILTVDLGKQTYSYSLK